MGGDLNAHCRENALAKKPIKIKKVYRADRGNRGSQSEGRDDIYVEGGRGLRWFFFAMAWAAVFGLGTRLYFNPNRIKKWADELLLEQGAQASLRFQAAELELASGSSPSFGLRLNGVDITPADACSAEPAVRIAHLRVPLSFTALFVGRLSIGTVSADRLDMDLDALKAHCPSHAQHNAVEKKRVTASVAIGDGPPSGGPPLALSAPIRWWEDTKLREIQARLRGLSVEEADIYFEKRSKRIRVTDLHLRPGARAGEVQLQASLVVPPELTYGESLPALQIDAYARADYAELNVRAGLSEGALKARAMFRPLPNEQLDTTMEATVRDVPVSTLAPLLTRSGIVAGGFKPRFMWMGCRASIHGKFQNIFKENPLLLEDCAVAGDGAQIRVARAVRQATGAWEPFEFILEKVDLGRLIEAFDWPGVPALLADYGRISGKGEVVSERTSAFVGDWSGVQLRFSRQSVPVVQKISTATLEIRADSERVQIKFPRATLDGGDFKGAIMADLDKRTDHWQVQADVEHLKLAEVAAKGLVGGDLGAISGHAHANFVHGHLEDLRGQVQVRDLHTPDVQIVETNLQLAAKSADTWTVTAKSRELELSTKSRLFMAAHELFFSRTFTDEWLKITDVEVHMRQPQAQTTGPAPTEVEWFDSRARIEGGHVRLTSAGSVDRERSLFGWVGIDYPQLKHLKWKLTGKTDVPHFAVDDQTQIELARHAVIDDHVLGLGQAHKAAAARE